MLAKKEAFEFRRFEISRFIFLTIREALEHEHRANTPMLTGMAFLTAAASAIFAAVYLRILNQNPWELNYILDHPILISFGVYIMFILIGTAFSVSVMRTKMEIPKNLKKKSKSEKNIVPKSLFFWKYIKEMNAIDWIKYITQTEELDLAETGAKHLAHEAYLLSSVVAYKHKQRKMASIFFFLALGAFAVFLGFALNVCVGKGLYWVFLFFGFIILAFVFLFSIKY